MNEKPVRSHAGHPLIIAHRGASQYAPENTLAAFSKAVDAGADGIEFDVRISRDGVPVVFHDSSLMRITGTEGRLSALMSHEIRRIPVGNWFNAKYPERARPEFGDALVPTLEQALEHLRSFEGFLYLEIKCKATEIARILGAVFELISESPLLPRAIIKSFLPDVLPEFRKLCPSANTAALFAPRIMTYLRKEKRIVEIAVELGANRLSIHYSLATRKLLNHAEAAGLPITIWTADSPGWVARSIELGIDSIITNDPSLLLETRQLSPQKA